VNAGTALDTLAQDPKYSATAILIYDVDNPPASRYSIWWQAFHSVLPGSTTAYLPMVMVDSGEMINHGEVNYYNVLSGVQITTTTTLLDVFKNMVDTAIYGSPEVIITPTYQISGNKALFDVAINNKSNQTFSYTSNKACIYAVIYENKASNVITTNVRDLVVNNLTGIGPKTLTTISLQSSTLSSINWNQMRFLVFFEYQPTGSTGYRSMLTSAYATKK
jgi:hypothetical protein